MLLLASVYNDFDEFPTAFIYIYISVDWERSRTDLAIGNQFRASHLDSHTCTVKTLLVRSREENNDVL